MASSWRQTLLFARQALIDPHRGSNLGIAWMYLQPLVMILIYTLVFSRFMSARLPGIDSPYAYSLYLVPGLLLWTVFANVVNGMAGVYQGKAHIIRKIPVDMRLMPLYLPLVEIVNFAVAMAFFVIFCAAIGHPPTLAWLLLVPVCLGTALMAYAIGLFLAVLSPFLPDLRPMTAIAVQLGFWLTPILYVPDLLPPWAAALLDYHPVYWIIQQGQAIVLYGRIGNGTLWAVQTAFSVVLCGLGWVAVRAAEREVRDLL